MNSACEEFDQKRAKSAQRWRDLDQMRLNMQVELENKALRSLATGVQDLVKQSTKQAECHAFNQAAQQRLDILNEQICKTDI